MPVFLPKVVPTQMNERLQPEQSNQVIHLSVTIFGRMSVQSVQLCPLISSARRTGASLRTGIWQFYNRKRALKSDILWHVDKEGETEK